MLTESGLMLQIHISETDQHKGLALCEWIVTQARECGIAGATVLRGIEGFGAHHKMHSVKVLRLAEDLPIVIEIVDLKEKVESFLQQVEPVVREGLILTLPVSFHLYRRRGRAEE